MTDTHDPLQPHSHEPNPEPPTADDTITVTLPDGRSRTLTPDDLRQLPYTAVDDCYIVSTGHGTSGPFTFGGVTLLDLVRHLAPRAPWAAVAVVSADGFGNRVFRHELENPAAAGPILLAYTRNGRRLTRKQGLVRLIVPMETDDALRQVKWITQIQFS